MAQLGNMKSSGNQPLSMMIPGAGQFVLVPQNQIQQIQQYQDAHLRQQMHASHPEVNEFNLERELANARPDMARAMLNNQRWALHFIFEILHKNENNLDFFHHKIRSGGKQ